MSGVPADPSERSGRSTVPPNPAPPRAAVPGLTRRPTRVDVAITLLAVAVLIVNVAHHEMWHDEINAFEIALHSPTLPALFHNLHYEGHPSLWYVLLWFASCVSANPVTAQVVHTGIVILIYVMVGLVSPFSTLEKILLLSGYFLGFEYAVVARNYSLAVLFALLCAEVRSRRPDLVVLNSVLLGLLANTTIFGLMMSGVLACEYVAALIRRAPVRSIAAGAAVYLAFVVACVLTVIPAPDIAEHGNAYLFQYAHKLWHLTFTVVSVVSLSFIPFNAAFPARYWIGMEPEMRTLWQVREAGLVLVVAALVTIFRKDLRLLAVIAVTGAAAALFCHLVYVSGIRQTGIFFVVVLTALWMQRMVRPGASWLVAALLLCGSIAGIEAQIGQWMRPFSASLAAARFLERNDWRDAGLIGMRDDWTIPVAQLLDRPLYGLDCQCFEDFLQFNAQHDRVPDAEIPRRLARALSRVKGQPPLLIYSNPWAPLDRNALELVGLRAIPLADFRGTESGENYLIYRIEPMW